MKTLQEFYDFYSAIPDERWCIGEFVKGKTSCALGLIGERGDCPDLSFSTKLFTKLLGLSMEEIIFVNDGLDDKYLQPTPKARILALIKSRM